MDTLAVFNYYYLLYLIIFQIFHKSLYFSQLIVDALHTTEPITLELDRNLQVLSPSQAAFRMNLPSDFYAISPEEIKREQQLRYFIFINKYLKIFKNFTDHNHLLNYFIFVILDTIFVLFHRFHRNEAMEKSLMLRTKAMREKDEMREFRKYRYTVLRIRFPDGILLQVYKSYNW